ncbi:MAG TPA: hypothetical protein ENI60_05505 [Candidatus Fraserbacteria bacterium]|nr:hypothetical protein [Candidatus Fraserbacteria bacterium]
MISFGALSLALRAWSYRYLALGLFAGALVLYLFTLPAAYTGGTIGLISLHYLNAELLFFSVALAALFSLVLTLNIYAFRAATRGQGRSLSLGAIFSSLLPSSVCCTSLVPSLLAAFGASTPQIFGLTGRIQGIFAQYEPLFLAFSLILLLFALWLAARNILNSCSLTERSVSLIGPTEEENQP